MPEILLTDPQKNQFAPDYGAIIEQRKRRFIRTIKSPAQIASCKKYYSTRPAEFIDHWGVTYDPRNISKGLPTRMPFALFPRQREFVDFLHQCVTNGENGAVNKCRDAGATWVAAGFSVWMYLFMPGSAIGWGSRKAELVDHLGDPKSIFDKIRQFTRGLPSFLQPAGYIESRHATFMKIINPENGSTIIGEAGDDIGRGGRTTVYFKDESAHYRHAESIEAALGNNTDVQIDISSVNGSNTVFQRRVDNGIIWQKGEPVGRSDTSVFIFEWWHDPRKDEAWYKAKEAKYIKEGLEWVFRQETDRDPNASIDGIVIPFKWVKAAVDAHKKIKMPAEGTVFSGQDVADAGQDSNAFAVRKGPILQWAESWHSGAAYATRRCVRLMRLHGVVAHMYDVIGVGTSAKDELNRLRIAGMLPPTLKKIIPWGANETVFNPEGRVIPGDRDSPTNQDYFANLASQAWFELSRRFERTYKCLTYGEQYPPESMISISSDIKHLDQLLKELSQPIWEEATESGKLRVNKKPSGGPSKSSKNKSGKSPNIADAVVMAYWPKKAKTVHI